MFLSVYLIIGVYNDDSTTKYKGFVILTEQERYESVRQCKFVDEVIENALWTITPEFIKNNKIDYVAHYAPYYCQGTEDVYDLMKKAGELIPAKREVGISTTSIITIIVKNLNLFVRRQLLRGIHYKDLNVSLFTKRKIEIANTLETELRRMVDEIKFVLNYWEKFSNKGMEKIIENFNEKAGFVRKN